MMGELLTLTEAATIATAYGLSRTQIAYAVRTGQLAVVKRKKKVKIGAPLKYRIHRDVFMQWLANREQSVPDDYLTVANAALEAKISIRTLYDAIKQGKVDYAEFATQGKRLRLYVRLVDVLTYIEVYGVRHYHT